MIRKILCWLGFHKWHKPHPNDVWLHDHQECLNCDVTLIDLQVKRKNHD